MIQTKIPVLEIVKPLPLTTETLLHLALKDRSVKLLEISVWEEEPQRLLNNATIVVFLKAAFTAIVIVITIAVTARSVTLHANACLIQGAIRCRRRDVLGTLPQHWFCHGRLP